MPFNPYPDRGIDRFGRPRGMGQLRGMSPYLDAPQGEREVSQEPEPQPQPVNPRVQANMLTALNGAPQRRPQGPLGRLAGGMAQEVQRRRQTQDQNRAIAGVLGAFPQGRGPGGMGPDQQQPAPRDNSAIVSEAYRQLLGREAEAEGLAANTRAVDERGLNQVLADIYNSDEGRQFRARPPQPPTGVSMRGDVRLRTSPDGVPVFGTDPNRYSTMPVGQGIISPDDPRYQNPRRLEDGEEPQRDSTPRPGLQIGQPPPPRRTPPPDFVPNGWDAQKWGTQDSVKYRAGEILWKYPPTPEGLRQAVQDPEFRELFPNARIVEDNTGDKIDFGGVLSDFDHGVPVYRVDVGKAFSAGGGEGWTWLDIDNDPAQGGAMPPGGGGFPPPDLGGNQNILEALLGGYEQPETNVSVEQLLRALGVDPQNWDTLQDQIQF